MPGELKSMKITKQERSDSKETLSSDVPEFPFGLSVSLDNESLEKLDMNTLPKVGEKMTILARVEVSSASQHSTKGGKDRKNVQLQITDMAIGPDIKSDAGKKLYGKE